MDYVEIWRKIIIGDNKNWVLFEEGTCVILMDPEEDLATKAINIMKEYGPVHVSTRSADFQVTELTNYPGWVVMGHHPDMLNYVSPDELKSDDLNDFVIGILGRSYREADSKSLNVVHIEDKR